MSPESTMDFRTRMDPIRSVNHQEDVATQNAASDRVEAAKIVSEMQDFTASASDQQIMDAVNRTAEMLGKQRVPEMTTLNPLNAGVESLVRKVPRSFRPESVPSALGLKAVEDLATGHDVRLDDSGDLLQLGAGVAGALVPQARLAKAGAGPLFGSGMRSIAGAAGASGLAGAVQQRMENAQELMDQANVMGSEMSRSQALKLSGETTTIEEMALRGLAEAMMEGAGSALAFSPLIAKSAFSKWAGIDEDAVDRMVGLAESNKIDLSIQDVANSRVIERARDTLGKFPIANRPFVEASERQAKQVGAAVSDSVASLAPVISEINELSGNAQAKRLLEVNLRGFNRAQGAFREFRDGSNALFDTFRRVAKADGATVGPANTSLQALIQRKKIRDLPRQRGPKNKDGSETLKNSDPQGMMRRVDRELTKILKMEPNPTLEQFIARGKEIEEIIKDLPKGSHAASVLIGIKQAMETDIKQNLAGSPGVLAARDAANAFYKEGMEVFSGQAAKKIKSVDRSFGKVSLRDVDPSDFAGQGLPDGGVVSPNNFISSVLDSAKDPGVIQNLYEMMVRGNRIEGKEAFKEMVAVHLDKAISGAAGKQVRGAAFPITDTAKLRRSLGLDNKKSEKYLAAAEMFRLSGSDIGKFDEVLGLADQFFKEGVPDVSTFISRRAVLGGLGSALRSFAPTQGKFGKNDETTVAFLKNVTATAASLLLMRKSAKGLTNPETLKNYRILLDPKRGKNVRMRAVRNLLVLDTGFLAIDDITGGKISEGQRLGVRGAVDVGAQISEGARNVAGTARSIVEAAPDFSRELNQ